MSRVNSRKIMRDIVLRESFYDRDTVLVARELLGKTIVAERNRRTAARIVETEAYVKGDPANHAFKGETKRNQSMFKGPGTLYVYSVHGHACMNAVTRPGEAVLLRAAEPIQNIRDRTSGPGLLCKAMEITLVDDGKSLISSEIYVSDDGYKPENVAASPRIGVGAWKDRHLRFYIEGNLFVSKPKKQRFHEVSPSEALQFLNRAVTRGYFSDA